MSMVRIDRARSRWLPAALAVLMAGTAATPVAAQAPAAPSPSAVENLVRLLVEQGIIKKDQGEALLRQAEAEAQQARAATVPAPGAPNAQVAGDLTPAPSGTIRVPYVPETVRAQIKDELKQEVLAQAKTEGWAAPGDASPDWVRNIRLFGDVRFRSQFNFYARNNSNLILDVERFNQNGPYDLTAPSVIVPTLNSRVDRRNIELLRARIGLEAKVDDALTMGVMFATGDDPSPVSTNEVLGGGFGKRDLWLQLAYLKANVVDHATVTFGRMQNPFNPVNGDSPAVGISTDLLFDPDLALDGIAGEVEFGSFLGENVHGFVRGGAFPIDFGANDYPSTSFDKRAFPQRYLFSGQIEGGYEMDNGIKIEAAVAYHAFTNMQGRLSTPCDIYSNDDIECSTDALRPLFPQKGNTVFFLRTFDTTFNPDPANPQEPQFLGLKFNYRVLDLNAAVHVPITDDIGVEVTGDYIRNLAFKRGDICRAGVAGQPLNNVSANSQGVCGTANAGTFDGGNEGYGVMVQLGYPDATKRGRWTVFGGYKYLESDATLDSFTDSDFHLGGTNAKGYILGGSYGIFDHLSIGARWLSANEIVDQPFSIDVLQIDLEGRF